MNYSRAEERLNYLSHGVAWLVSLLGFVYLIQGGMALEDGLLLVGFIIFGLCMIACFATSTIYHWVKSVPWKRRWRLIDHAAIYLMIAGSYTPFIMGNLREGLGLGMLALIWILALGGISFKLLIRKNIDRYKYIDLLVYIFLGSIALFFIRPIVDSVAFGGIILLLVGGASYLVGTFFYNNDRIPYNHAIWHLFVIGGAASHYFSILYYVKPPILAGV